MQHYTDTQLYSFALLLLFTAMALWRTLGWLFRSPSKRYLKRFTKVKKLKRLTWSEFEHLCKLLFEEEGWRVRENETKGADGGVDLRMKRRGTTAIVQCKRYEDARVGVKVVREMYGLMYEYDVDHAYVVTTSEFTKECYRFAEGKEMTLINGEALLERIRRL